MSNVLHKSRSINNAGCLGQIVAKKRKHQFDFHLLFKLANPSKREGEHASASRGAVLVVAARLINLETIKSLVEEVDASVRSFNQQSSVDLSRKHSSSSEVLCQVRALYLCRDRSQPHKHNHQCIVPISTQAWRRRRSSVACGTKADASATVGLSFSPLSRSIREQRVKVATVNEPTFFSLARSLFYMKKQLVNLPQHAYFLVPSVFRVDDDNHNRPVIVSLARRVHHRLIECHPHRVSRERIC